MRPRRSIIIQVAWLMIVIIMASTVGVAFLAARISSRGVQEISQIEMQEAVEQAEGMLLAYARGEYTQEQLQEMVNPAFRPGQWYLQLTDPDGRVLAQTDGAEGWFQENAEREQRIILMGEMGQEMMRTIAGIDYQNFITQVVSQDGVTLGSVHLGRQMNLVEDKSALLSTRLLFLILALLLLFGIFLFMMARWIVIPAYRLIGASRAMAAGNFRVRADESVPGEMGYLSSVFNNMADELYASFEALKYEKSSMVLVLEGLSEGILAIDLHGEVIHRNAVLRQLLGTRTQEVERDLFRMLHVCLRDGQEWERTLWVQETCLEILVSPIFGEGEAVLGAVALVRDITTKQRLEQTRHDYVANITHELRTPLATMRGLMEPLADGLVEEEKDRQRYYHIILQEILRLSRLVNDLLELSGLQSGQAAIEIEEVDVPLLLFELKERFEKAYAEKGVAWQVEAPEEELLVMANEDRLSQVLTILVDNALKYTGPGGTACLSVEPQAGDKLRFCVRDTGVGIEPQHLAHLFDRFYQADRSHSERGNGLGLSIAQEILGKMDMELLVQSQVGKGSLFYFDVPLA